MPGILVWLFDEGTEGQPLRKVTACWGGAIPWSPNKRPAKTREPMIFTGIIAKA